MFVCEICEKVSAPREKQVHQTVEVRPRVYRDDRGEVIGQGSEIVRERVSCAPCAGQSVPANQLEKLAFLGIS